MAANKSMFWRLIFQALRLRLQRVFIIFSALTVGASIVTAMAAVYFDINTKMSQELRTFGANFYIGAANGGLMKALGAYQWQIALLFYCEAIISALIGGSLGCIAGWGLARFIGSALFGVPLSFAWIVIPCVLMLSILIAVVGTWFPAHRIAKLYPVEVLYGRQ